MSTSCVIYDILGSITFSLSVLIHCQFTRLVNELLIFSSSYSFSTILRHNTRHCTLRPIYRPNVLLFSNSRHSGTYFIKITTRPALRYQCVQISVGIIICIDSHFLLKSVTLCLYLVDES